MWKCAAHMLRKACNPCFEIVFTKVLHARRHAYTQRCTYTGSIVRCTVNMDTLHRAASGGSTAGSRYAGARGFHESIR
eukprot:6058295-Lingulodinium_polyedra.AAC.1